MGRARTLEAEIVARSEEKERLETQISKLQGNLQAIPLRAQQFADLQRSFEAAKGDYENLQDKIRETELASKVERRLQGQRFRVQDFASLPDHPYQPDRLKLNLAGVAAGMMLGVVLAGGLELMDTSIKSDEDLIFYTELKNLAVIPLLPTQKERGRALFRRIMGWTAGVISVLGSGTLLYYLYFVRM